MANFRESKSVNIFTKCVVLLKRGETWLDEKIVFNSREIFPNHGFYNFIILF